MTVIGVHQVNQATISGAVPDATGSMVPSVRIELLSISTGLHREREREREARTQKAYFVKLERCVNQFIHLEIPQTNNGEAGSVRSVLRLAESDPWLICTGASAPVRVFPVSWMINICARARTSAGSDSALLLDASM